MTIITLESGLRIVLEHVTAYEPDGHAVLIHSGEETWTAMVEDNIEALGELARFFGDKALGKALYETDLSDLAQL